MRVWAAVGKDHSAPLLPKRPMGSRYFVDATTGLTLEVEQQ
ncbi:hypothetical protein [Nakamurella panacisegetis]|nr:hypothetical protein [Nakamurella panacisegetis]